MLARVFRLAGQEVSLCDNAARAVELIKSERFDLIFSDVVMPGSVAPLPVTGQLAGAVRQDLAGQAPNPHPGQDQKPAVVDDERQVARPLLGAPADPAVPHRHLPGRAGPLQASQDLICRALRAHQVAQLGPHRHPIAQVVVALDQFYP